MSQPSPREGQYVYSPKVRGEQAVIRRQLSQWSAETVGIQISNSTTLLDPSDIIVSVFKRDDYGTNGDPVGGVIETFTMIQLTREDVGVYSFQLNPIATEYTGLITVEWEYVVDGVEYKYQEYFQVLEPMPYFNALNDAEKGIVDEVMLRFADLYDSDEGGPFLKTPFQTHFGTERVAQLALQAVTEINYAYQPVTTFFVGQSSRGTRFPVGSYGLLSWGLYLEVIRHLIRSYVEQPVHIGFGGLAIDDRRDYMQRWQSVLQSEEDRYMHALAMFKRQFLGLGGGNLLVAGGLFGRSGYFSAANGYYSAALRTIGRYYPISFVVGGGMSG